MKIMSKFNAAFILLIVFASVISCSKETNELPAGSLKEIISFDLKMANGTSFTGGTVVVSIQGDSIDITIPDNINLSQLIPYIAIKGKSISPASEVPQNFDVPLIYTVTAADGSTVQYTVTVHSARAVIPTVYVGNGNDFYALNALTGMLIWKYAGTASFAYSSATYDSGIIYVGGIDNYVYAFDAVTGNIKWKNLIASTGIESDAVYVNGTVYVGTNDDYLYALEAATGQIKWRFLTGGNVSASPTVLNNVVYFGSSDGSLYALNANTGDPKWQFQTGAMINQSGPALVNGVVYVGSRDSYLYAVDANTGALVWKYYADGISLEQSSPTVANGIVYIGGWYNLSTNAKGSLYALNAITGELLWKKLETGISSSPCVANGKVYITCDDLKIHALNAATGDNIWEKEILPNSANPAVSNGTVYVGGGGMRYFYALDSETGDEKWRFPTPSGLMTSSPLIINASGTAYYSGSSGLMQ